MFGLSFGELLLLVTVAIVVIGPEEMPKVLRTAGLLAGRLRRMAIDVRAQSGIDEVLREGSLTEDIAEIRKLAQADFLSPATRARPPQPGPPPEVVEVAVLRDREFPREGADAYDATPDTAILYAAHRTLSPLARDPLYVAGDATAVLPPPEEPAPAGPPEPVEATESHERPAAPDAGARAPGEAS